MKRTSSPTAGHLYDDLAWLWPILSDPAHYRGEAASFRDAIRGHATIPTRTLLDLGCGGGHNDSHLKRDFQVTGVDLSAGMLAHARRLNPEATYIQGDLRTVRLGQVFDAVIIADAIDYMLTEADLAAAFATAHAHLRPGGVFCTYAEYTPRALRAEQEQVLDPEPGGPGVRLPGERLRPRHQRHDFRGHLRLPDPRAGPAAHRDRRELLGLFDLPTWRRLLAAAGFEVIETHLDEEDGPPIPMFVCLKRA